MYGTNCRKKATRGKTETEKSEGEERGHGRPSIRRHLGGSLKKHRVDTHEETKPSTNQQGWSRGLLGGGKEEENNQKSKQRKPSHAKTRAGNFMKKGRAQVENQDSHVQREKSRWEEGSSNQKGENRSGR